MSLINDALKRAKEAQQKNTPPVAAPTPVQPTAMPSMKVRRNRRDWSWILPVLTTFLILAAFFVFGLAMARRAVKTIVTVPEVSTTQQVETVVAAPPPSAPAPPPPEAVAPATTINNMATTEVPEPPRIQGIAYDPVHPWAIVSGKTVFVGDFVNGMRVVAISRHSISLAGNGQTNRFIVGQQ
jgi:hypothetical protein